MKDELLEMEHEKDSPLLSLQEIRITPESYISATLMDVEKYSKNGKTAVKFVFITDVAQRDDNNTPAKLFITTYEKEVPKFFPFGYTEGGIFMIDKPDVEYSRDGTYLQPADGYRTWSFPPNTKMLFYDIVKAEEIEQGG